MRATTYYTQIDSPAGQLFVQGDGQFVTGLYFAGHPPRPVPDDSWRHSAAPFETVREQLAEYFAGRRKKFDVPLQLAGTTFQCRVWQELMGIPFGTTLTYAELAQRIGQPMASRAVGRANGRNPISILVPCHRVVGSNGKLIGYAGGIQNKQRLLELEQISYRESRQLVG